MPQRLQPPDPPLTDAVVLLRPISPFDVDAIFAACQDERLQRFIPVPVPYARRDAEDFVHRTRRQWATGEKAAFAITTPAEPDDLVGAISLSVAGGTGNCGYWIAPGQRGRGTARRALALVTEWAFETLGLAVILLEINEQNPASRELATAVGYHQAGRIDVNTETGERGNLIYSRLVAD